MMRYEVRIEESDGSTDIVPVWAPSDEEAISLAVTWIDYVERRPMYSQPASATAIGSTPEEGDLSDTTTSPNDVAHRRISRDGVELGTLRRPVRQRLIELRDRLRTSDSAGWRELRERMNDGGVWPEDCAIVSAGLDAAGDPLFGIIISRQGSRYGFVRDESGRMSIGDAQEAPESPADPLARRSKMALDLLEEPGS